MKNNFLVALYTFTLTGLSQPLVAATINWGPSESGGDFLSSGQPLTPTVIFEMGVFDLGFDPTELNTNDWETFWTPVSTSSYNPTQTNYGTQVTQSDFSGAGVTSGLQVYIWGFNQKPIDSTTQWVLYSADNPSTTQLAADNWVSPGGLSDQASPAVDWSPATSNQVVFGATSTNTGGGLVDSPVVLAGDQVQLYKVIPELNSVMLLAFGSLVFLRRKR